MKNRTRYTSLLGALAILGACENEPVTDAGRTEDAAGSINPGLDGGPGADDAGDDPGDIPDGGPGADDAGDDPGDIPAGGDEALGWTAPDGNVDHGSRLRIHTDGTLDFGEAEQAAPVLVDHVSHAYENGVRNDHQGAFSDMQLIGRPDVDPDTLWEKPSKPSSAANTGMLYTTSRPHRHPHSDAHYYAVGNDNFLGWPTAYGGGAPTSASRTLYASWWCKMPFDLKRYYAIPADAAETSFVTGGDEEYGEEITVSGMEGTGRVIAHRVDLGDGSVSEGWLFFEPPMGFGGTGSLHGRTITGVTSGASVVFPETSSTGKFDQRGFLSPRGKYARFWDDIGGEGFRFSIGNYSVSGAGGTDSFNAAMQDGENWNDRLVRPGEWNHWEVELVIDTASPETMRRRVSVNNTVILETSAGFVDEVTVLGETTAPTIALLGINDFMPVVFTTEISDIYMDERLSRVALGDAPQLDDVVHLEIQRYTSWTSAEVEVIIHRGELEDSPVWLYVIGPDGSSLRQAGVPVSE